MGHVDQRPEMDVAGRRDHCVDLADLGVKRIDRPAIADIDMDIAAFPSRLDDLVTAAQRCRDGPADRALRTDDENAHQESSSRSGFNGFNRANTDSGS